MTCLERLKTAIYEKKDLDAIDEWDLGLSKSDYKLVAPRMGLTAEEVQIYAEARGLDVLLKIHNNALEEKERFVVESALGERFHKDIIPAGFPWSSVEKLRDTIDEAMWRRRAMIVSLLFEIANEEVLWEKLSQEEKERERAVPEMRQDAPRKTLAWHREQARKLLKEKMK